MRILVVGAGATGGFYGALLARAGRDVTFLLRERRAQQVRESGLLVKLHTGEHLRLDPLVVTASDLRQFPTAFDLVILSTKSYQFEGALQDVAPAVTPDTMLMPILNGMRQFSILGERFNPAQVVGGSVRIMSYLDEHNQVIQMSSLDQLNFGELTGERTSRILAVEAALQGCGFTASLQPDIVATLWQKWFLLASLGTVCVLAGGTVGQAAAVPHGQEVALAVIAECAAIAAANGYPPPPELVLDHKERLTSPDAAISTSLYRDMVAGYPVEADHILGDLIARAQAMEPPLLKSAYVRMKVYETTRSTQAASLRPQ